MPAYYNEHDKYAAAWLRNLIAAGHIAPGDVDERSIEDVKPSDLIGYTQCHFFAGIGVWSYALRRAGWADDRPVWTGSCPCQPFSAAGKRGGAADERHLWPHWNHLIAFGKPRDVPVFGEQVASKDGLAWLDLVHADLEGQGYAVGAIDLCAAGVGAPHIRQRLYFVAHAKYAERRAEQQEHGDAHRRNGSGRGSNTGVAQGDTLEPRLQEQRSKRGAPSETSCGKSREAAVGASTPTADGVGNSVGAARERNAGEIPSAQARLDSARLSVDGDMPVGSGDASTGLGSFWSACDWLPCIDGKARPVEPGTFPLAHGASARVGRLRAYGNAIVAPCAEAFIKAYLAR